jgi:hypothetical protein
MKNLHIFKILFLFLIYLIYNIYLISLRYRTFSMMYIVYVYMSL